MDLILSSAERSNNIKYQIDIRSILYKLSFFCSICITIDKDNVVLYMYDTCIY